MEITTARQSRYSIQMCHFSSWSRTDRKPPWFYIVPTCPAHLRDLRGLQCPRRLKRQQPLEQGQKPHDNSPWDPAYECRRSKSERIPGRGLLRVHLFVTPSNHMSWPVLSVLADVAEQPRVRITIFSCTHYTTQPGQAYQQTHSHGTLQHHWGENGSICQCVDKPRPGPKLPKRMHLP